MRTPNMISSIVTNVRSYLPFSLVNFALLVNFTWGVLCTNLIETYLTTKFSVQLSQIVELSN